MNNHLTELENQGDFKLKTLEEGIKARINNGDFGYNSDKTKRRIFLKTVITDAEGSHIGVELANTYGLISKKDLNDYYEMTDFDQVTCNIKYELKAKKLEEFFSKELSKKTSLSGDFFFGWEDVDHKLVTELCYGLCYSEDIVPVNN
ncbi:hypothetical protein [Priestia megaterium]|uniref:Uncharacterized protein n=1 Tax=Priestia megaterium TaxID=1404 RepID=A0A6M6E7H7_PRIMG|nr:hypothetical protein [Priestia megaterium]QJX80507.1 hypothetical protein FDZ14_30940 [Priestia megaterium]